MDSTKLFLAPECLGKNIELVDVRPDYYGNTKVQHAEPVGYRYIVLLREHASDRLTVKIMGPRQIDAPLTGTGIMVAFDGLRVWPYVSRDTGKLAYSATADAIKPVTMTK